MTRSLPKKCLLSLLVAVVVIGLAEVGLRILGLEDTAPSPAIVARSIDGDIEFPFMTHDRVLFWRLIPGFKGDFLGHPVTINSLGVRGAEVDPAAKSYRKRIICFGDSITFGYGVGDTDTYAYLLEQTIGTERVQVVNCGVTGYTSYQVTHLYRELERSLPCEVATFCIGWNDATLRPMDDEQYAEQIRRASSPRLLSEYSYLYRLFRNSLVGSDTRGRSYEVTTTRVPFDQFQCNVEGLITACRAQNVRPMFLELPCRKEREAPFGHPYSTLLRSTCAKMDVPVVDIGCLSPEHSEESNEEYFLDECHYNAKGHQYLADRLAAAFVELGIVDAPIRQ